MTGRTQWVFYFGDGRSEADPAMADLVGSKGAGLAAMTRAGLPVPPGFTISAECCRHFLENDESWPDGLEDQVRANLARLEEATGRRFGRGHDPLLLAVRSGAAASMPGMMDTILNCGLVPGADDEPGQLSPWNGLVDSINAVFRSWNSERAIAYRGQHGLHALSGTAVTVQAMFPSEIAGVLFTRDPAEPTTDHMLIECSQGLGDTLVSGDVTPDRFVVTRDRFECERSAVADSTQADTGLPEQRIAELAELGLRVEALLGEPADIEWGWADGRFALFQCRPITGLDIAQDVEVGRQAEVTRLRELAGAQRRVWVAHNLGETLQHPTPLTWDIVSDFMSGSGGFGLMYRDLGYSPPKRLCEQGFLELICGRIYVDPERLAGVFCQGMPLRYGLDAVRHNARLLERAPTSFDPEKAGPLFLLRLPAIVRSVLRTKRNVERGRGTAQATFEDGCLPTYLEYVHAKGDEDLSALDTPEVVAELHERRTRVLNDFGKESLKPGFHGAMALAAVETTLVQLMGKDEGRRLARTLTTGLDGDVTVEQNALLYGVATGEATMDEFLQRFGHRAVGEMELSEPRWREDTQYLGRVVAGLRRCGRPSPRDRHAENARRRRLAETDLPSALAHWGGSSFEEDVQENLRLAQRLLPYRETGKHYLMMGYELIRQAILELSRRWSLGNDVFFLHLDELQRFEAQREKLTPEIARRKVRWQSAQRLDMQEIIDTDEIEQLGLGQVYEAASEIAAQAVSPGVATGPARIVLDAREAADIGVDYILTCPSTDPGWAPLFIHARGLIVERGGTLSHGAIVARGMGIPAVVLPGATARLRDGQQIRLDGNRGRITILRADETARGGGSGR